MDHRVVPELVFPLNRHFEYAVRRLLVTQTSTLVESLSNIIPLPLDALPEPPGFGLMPRGHAMQSQ